MDYINIAYSPTEVIHNANQRIVSKKKILYITGSRQLNSNKMYKYSKKLKYV